MNIFLIGGTTVARGHKSFPDQQAMLRKAMTPFGRHLIEEGHNLLVCSPFDDSADLPAVRGAVPVLLASKADTARVQYHHPDSPSVLLEWKKLSDSLSCPALRPFRYRTPFDDLGKEQLQYAWLLAQLSALDKSQAVVAVGGKVGKVAGMLLALAIDRKIPTLPVPFLGGEAAHSFDRLEKVLGSYLGDRLDDVRNPERSLEILPLLTRLVQAQMVPGTIGEKPKFFISYSYDKPSEADVVENLLLRHGYEVFRDRYAFQPGAPLPDEIRDAIHRATVFVAIWRQEYACSPWCFDEMEIALELREAGRLILWIFCMDGTRMVPPKARPLSSFRIDTREELEGKLSELLVRFQSPKS